MDVEKLEPPLPVPAVPEARARAPLRREALRHAIGKRAVEIAVEVPEAVPLERNFDGHYPADAIALGPDYGKY